MPAKYTQIKCPDFNKPKGDRAAVVLAGPDENLYLTSEVQASVFNTHTHTTV